MVKIQRAASIPLLLSDPYFSIWSPADHLYDRDTESWTGKKMPIRGYLKVGACTYRFLGADNLTPIIPQTALEVTATQTKATFENAVALLTVTFSGDLDLADLDKIAEPVTMITTTVTSKQGLPVSFSWQFSEEICREAKTSSQAAVNWQAATTEIESFVWMGKARQTPLNAAGDLVDIDWGHLYLAFSTDAAVSFAKDDQFLTASWEGAEATTFLVAYDDFQAINYFGRIQPALWKMRYSSMLQLLQTYLQQRPARLASCCRLDQEIAGAANDCGGATLDFLTALAYRQAICAHKLIRDEHGQVIFLSKECSSNGCIGTVDISYPSLPLFLLYQPELVKGMLRPVYRFAALPVWEFPFAPHDVGCYPYATGQVYGCQQAWQEQWQGSYDTIFDIYGLPPGQGVYEEAEQMPVEECGNVLLMSAALYLVTGDEAFFKEYLPVNQKWADYLLVHGPDPENQLCTDDFAGHLAHNANLALKAIVAIGLFGKALLKLEPEAGGIYQEAAKRMAKSWLAQSAGEKCTKLAFDQTGTWSLKYNLIWDRLFALQLFPESLGEQELAFYLSQMEHFGIPLDSRAAYTKADWLMWLTVLAKDPKQQEALMQPIQNYLEQTPTRVPFSDWYDTQTGRMINFKNRSVVGAMFMPLLQKTLQERNEKEAGTEAFSSENRVGTKTPFCSE